MKGPESPRNEKGSQMTTEPEVKRWSQEEARDGESILAYIKTHVDTNVVADKYAQASKAARTLKLLTRDQTFRHLSPGLKSYLEFIWWLDTPEGRKWLLLKNLPTEDEWLKQIDPHTLHPEDELKYIKHLNDLTNNERT